MTTERTGPIGNGAGPYSIGGTLWPGLSKLIEECGEVVQVAGKLIGSGGEVAHWDGTDLRLRLESELGDLLAAILFVNTNCRLDKEAIALRSREKLALFEGWHTEHSGRIPSSAEDS